MGGECRVKAEVSLSFPPSGAWFNTDRLLMTVERTRLEFNEMSRSSSECLAEITAADEYGAAVIKATESNLSKKGSSVFVSHPVDTRHPSRVTPHFTNLFQYENKLGEKEKKNCAVMSYSGDPLMPE